MLRVKLLLCKLGYHRPQVYSGHRKTPGPRLRAGGKTRVEIEKVCQTCGHRWWEVAHA